MNSPRKYHTHRILLVFTPFFEFEDDFFHQLIHGCVGRRTHKHAVLLDLGVGVFIQLPPPLVPQFATCTKQTKTPMSPMCQCILFSTSTRIRSPPYKQFTYLKHLQPTLILKYSGTDSPPNRLRLTSLFNLTKM